MRIGGGGRSSNLEDRRGDSPRGFGMGGMGGRGMGLGAILFAAFMAIVFKADFFSMLGLGQAASRGIEQVQPAPQAGPAQGIDDPAEEPMVRFVSGVLDDAQAFWAKTLPATMGAPYRDAKLVLFRDVNQSACGRAQAAMGPFYCPLDEKVYIDLSFYDELARRFQAPGDFAQAYVLAHELGHHVQTILGTSEQVQRLQQQRPQLANQASVRLELQADCYAGAWGHSAAQRGLLEPGDMEEGLRAATAIGDDNIQRQTQGRVAPESFTHGSSEQRLAWFKRGLDTGDPRQCDTFAAR
jgi:predicted metalloprotease